MKAPHTARTMFGIQAAINGLIVPCSPIDKDNALIR